MKKIKLFLVLFISIICFSCENKHNNNKEDLLIDIVGEWTLYNGDSEEGTIMFDEYESFMMESNKGVLYGNYSMLPNKSNVLSFYYIENEDGEEYSFDGFTEIKAETPDIILISNLPLYEDVELKAIRQ